MKAEGYTELQSLARELEWLPGRYTHLPGVNSARIVDMLCEDIYSIASRLKDIAGRLA